MTVGRKEGDILNDKNGEITPEKKQEIITQIISILAKNEATVKQSREILNTTITQIHEASVTAKVNHPAFY